MLQIIHEIGAPRFDYPQSSFNQIQVALHPHRQTRQDEIIITPLYIINHQFPQQGYAVSVGENVGVINVGIINVGLVGTSALGNLTPRRLVEPDEFERYDLKF